MLLLHAGPQHVQGAVQLGTIADQWSASLRLGRFGASSGALRGQRPRQTNGAVIPPAHDMTRF